MVALPVISVVLIVMAGSVYYLISNLLTNDFTMKSEDFSNRIANSVQLQMDHICYSVNLYLNKTRIAADMTMTNVNVLQEVKNYAPSVVGAMLFDTNDILYASNSYYYGEIANAVMEKIDKEGGGTQWMIIEPAKSMYKKQILFLCVPVQLEQSTVGYLVADVDPKAFSQTISTDNLFLKNTTVFFRSGESAIVLAGEAAWSEEFLQPGERSWKTKEKNLVCNISVWEDGSYLVFDIPMTVLKLQMKTALLVLLVFLLLCLVIYALSLKRMVLRISKSLKRIYDKMTADTEKIIN